jgi:alanyl-tRNA synthetase
MQVNEIREAFLAYFSKHDHTIVPSSPIVPMQDDTLLFVNAGMVPFKQVFLGQEKLGFTRAVDSQCCIRAGGKHNDLENVGYTARHHTFFEMLGNFSFGDYFKEEAIKYSWEFLTKVLNIPTSKLWVTVYEKDREAEDLWINVIGVDKNRISRCGEKDNFWSMGDTGPCGPCSEIFYDHGESVAGGPPGSPDEDGDRYVEIWNLVFMQYNRDSSGKMTPLPKPSIDTGMGLERLAAVLQGVHSNFEIDLFQSLIKFTAKTIGCKDLSSKSLRVIADHIRSTCFLIAEGVHPGNEGRGYVLRRIMRRAIRHGHQLGSAEPFMHKLVQPLAELMGDAYPVLREKQKDISNVILQEENKFHETLSQGMRLFEQAIAKIKDEISGEVLFKLYDTYGFPVDLTADLARERGLKIDMKGFNACMEEQKQRARSASQFKVDYSKYVGLDGESDFEGYEGLDCKSKVIYLFDEKSQIKKLNQGQSGEVVLQNTTFYAESGGQVGDVGVLQGQNGVFEVLDTQKNGNLILHIGKVVDGYIEIGEKIEAKVNSDLRTSTILNHSATHLLHAALREILGTHVTQKGSLVAPDRLRFDFSHTSSLTKEELEKVESIVNEKILLNSAANITETTPEKAQKMGAMALFGEKYGDTVRVLEMAEGYSVELCGGTHVKRTGDIGLFVITVETGVAAGIRRIEALTGAKAFNWLRFHQKELFQLGQALKVEPTKLLDKIKLNLTKTKEQEKTIHQLKHKLATGGSDKDAAQDFINIGDIKLLVQRLEGIEPKLLRSMMDDLKSKIGQGVVVIAAVNENKVQLIVGVTKGCTDRVSAGELVGFIAPMVGGKGGGRKDMAQAGGSQPEQLDEALKNIKPWIEERIL